MGVGFISTPRSTTERKVVAATACTLGRAADLLVVNLCKRYTFQRHYDLFNSSHRLPMMGKDCANSKQQQQQLGNLQDTHGRMHTRVSPPEACCIRLVV